MQEKVSLSPQTVANITNELESIGLIVSRRQKDLKTRGQPPIAFEINPDAGQSIGISLEPGRASARWSIWWAGSMRAARCRCRAAIARSCWPRCWNWWPPCAARPMPGCGASAWPCPARSATPN
ncbi:hypothetical protein [Lysobacter gummosus]|uniref:hypothetical protein n=1 Tax=Lysobacter gummosus TaxID=262324 RepID=UPI00362C0A70